MKKLILTALLAVLATGSTFANNIEINSIARQNFKRDFKNVSQVQWQSYRDFTFAVFNKDGEIIKAYYNQDGELYGTSSAVNVKDLPVAAKRSLARKYSTFTITEAIRFNGLEESAYFVTAKKDNEIVVLKTVAGELSISKRFKI